jgi:hypothetical protein
MSKLQLSRLTNTAAARHTVTVKLPLAGDGGVVKEEQMDVVYRGMSLREMTEMEERLAKLPEDDATRLAMALAETVVGLPGVEGEEGAAVEPSVEFFQTLDVFVLHRINKTIREDRTANPTS